MNETKTRLCPPPGGVRSTSWVTLLDGATISSTGAAYLAASPAKKKIAELCDAIGEQTIGTVDSSGRGREVGRLNGNCAAGANYFDSGPSAERMRR